MIGRLWLNQNLSSRLDLFLGARNSGVSGYGRQLFRRMFAHAAHLLLVSQLILLVPFSARASNETESFSDAWSGELQDLNWHAVGQDAVAPFDIRVASSGAWILAGGAVLTGGMLAYESSSDQHFQNWMATHHPLGASSRAGDIWGQALPNALYVGGMLIAAAFGNSSCDAAGGRLDCNSTCGPGVSHRVYIRRARLMFEATLWASVYSTALKYAAHERRPDHSSRDSFPSGHSTTAFAFAAVVAQEHGWYWGTAAYAAAAFTGLSRVDDNRHYIHDVTAGAAIGSAFGVAVWQMFKYRDAKLAENRRAAVTSRENAAGNPREIAETATHSGSGAAFETDANAGISTQIGIAPLDGHGWLLTTTIVF